MSRAADAYARRNREYRRLTWVACHLVDAAREAIPGIERGAVLDGLVARCGEPHE